MTDEKDDPIPYEVIFLYSCQFCKKGHLEYGRLVQPGVVLTHQGELKKRLLELVKEKFSKAHPNKKFDLTKLTVEEFVNGNKTVVDPETIVVEEVKGEDLTKPKPSEETIDVVVPVSSKVAKGKMGFEEITNIVKTRIAELGGEVKEYERKIKELTTATTAAEQEMTSLEVLLEGAEKVKPTKPKEEEKKK